MAHHILTRSFFIFSKETKDGLEKNFATNTVGTHLLTQGLLPAIKKSSDPRVVIVSSGGMLTQKLNLGDLQTEKGSFDGTMVYAQNKRQQVIMTHKYAERNPDVFFASMHPGKERPLFARVQIIPESIFPLQAGRTPRPSATLCPASTRR